MDITAFIRELLFSHDCVIVPGFGGFIGNYTPARIDKAASTFYPPVKQISFNRNLNHNDGLLVGRISEHAGINYNDARIIVDEFVAGLRKKLGKGEKVVFDHIGTFINNQEGNVQFEPDKTVNYHLDSYGLEPFVFSPLEAYDIRKRISGRTVSEPVKSVFNRKVIWRAAAVIVPLLALMVTVPLKTDLFRSKVETSNLNPLAKAEFEENRAAVDSSMPEVAIPSSEATAEPVITEAVQPAEPSDSYYIITGSFKLRQNAELQAKALSGEGYSPEIIEAPNGFYRVSAMRCQGLSSAEASKNSISKIFPGSWIRKI
jgi:nucleoid DNA-binding protein